MCQRSVDVYLKQGIRVLTLVLFVFLGFKGADAAVKDSVGIKVKGGKIYIMHKVEPGQGLFSVSRRYNVPIEEILEANPTVTEMLQKDQILLIPTGKDAPFEEQVVKEYFDEKKDKPQERDTITREVSSTFARYHKVKAGETLYSIAKAYNTRVSVLMDLNGMRDEMIAEGQKILVPVREDELPVTAEQKPETREERISELEEELVQLRKRIHGKDTVMVDTVAVKKKPLYEKQIDKVEKYDVVKITEKGIATIFTERNVDQQQRYASHHEAEIGTIIMVTNPETSQSVFVKVIRNHTLNDDKSNMIILTQSAAERLNIRSGTPVEISYAR